VAGVLALLALLLFFAYFDSLAQYALKSASSDIPGRLQVRQFSPTFAGIRADGVRWELADRDPFFVADRVELTVDGWALLRKDWPVLVRQARVFKPGLRVVVDADGSLNLEQLLSQRDDAARIDLHRLRGSLEFQQGWILYNDRRDAGFLYELSDWSGHLALRDGQKLAIASEARRKEDPSSYRLSGELSLGTPGLSLDLDLGQIDLLPFAGFPGFGPGLTLVQGTVNGSAMVQASADEWKDLMSAAFVVGEIELREGLLAAPWLPIDLKAMRGKVALLGREVSTERFEGTAADIPFSVEGKAELDPGGDTDGRLVLSRFDLAQLKPYLDNPPEVKGQAEVEVEIGGTLDEPSLSGVVRGFDLSYQGQSVSAASADFLKVRDLLYLEKVVAETAAGRITGQGWVFLEDEPRVLFALSGSDTDLSVMLPDLARSANFQVRVLGQVADPLLYGQGRFEGLGAWAQGVGDAQGRFILTGQDLLVLDGQANRGESTVRMPIAAVDIQRRQMDGIVSTEGFSLADLPGLSGIGGQVSGSAFVSADLSQPTPQIAAQGVLSHGVFESGGYRASAASGEFSFDGHQLTVPDAYADFAGGRLNLSGVYDLRDRGLAVSVRGESIDSGLFGVPGANVDLLGSLSGRLGGELGLSAYASAPQGRLAMSGFQRADGSVGGVAWADGGIPGQQGSEVQALVVASGIPERLSLEFVGSARSSLTPKVSPIDIYGGAMLAGDVLTIRPTLVTGHSEEMARPQPVITYSGQAYPLFGPLLAGPLEKVVVEVPAAPSSRSLNLSGQARLASQKLDLRFDMRVPNLAKFAEQPVGPEGITFNEAMPFDVLSGFGSVRGAITGTLGHPRVDASYELPWLLLANGFENRRAVSSKGRVRLSRQILSLDSAAVSETPFDRRLARDTSALFSLASDGDGIFSLKGMMEADGDFDLRLATAGFDAGFLALVTPREHLRYLPYGRLATENLHLWGSAAVPSLAGAVRLVQGGVFLSEHAFPFQMASLNFSSQGGEIRVEEMLLRGPGLNVEGAGKRSAGGELSGRILVKDADLAELQPLGLPFSGLSGTADAVLELQGRLPQQPRIEVAARAHGLTWNPAVLGGSGAAVPIEELALGHFAPDGQSLESGLAVSLDQSGWLFELPSGGLRLRTGGQGLSLEAEGAVRFPGGLPDLRMFKTFSDWSRYLCSASGPEFGRTGVPFRVRGQNWSFAQLSRLLGRSDLPYRASGSGTLALEGQWWRDHRPNAATQLPHYSLNLESLSFEGERAGQTSGFSLKGPANLAYQRQGDAGFLSLDSLTLGFFSLDKVPASPDLPESPPETRVNERGTLQADARLALTQLPGARPESRLQLAALDIPLGHLAFMLPDQVSLDGLLQRLEIRLDGLLPTPSLGVVAQIADLSIGPLQDMALIGKLTGTPGQDGSYLVSLGDQSQPAVTLSFGQADAESHQLTAQGQANLKWERISPVSSSALAAFSEGLEVSMDSPIDLAANVVDKGLQVIADAVPGDNQGRGDLSAILRVGGTLGHPEFEGKASLANGSFRSQLLGNFENLQLEATVERISRDKAQPSEMLKSLSSAFVTRFHLPKFEGTWGKKPFFAGGQAELAGISPTFLDLFFVGEALPVVVPNLFSGSADVDLQMVGQVQTDSDGRPQLSPVILGTVVVPRGEFEVPVGAVQGDSKLQLPLGYDVTIDLGQEFFARMYGSSVRAVGELRLISGKAGKPEIYGRVDLSRGLVRIPFYDASFRIRHGIAHFDGPMMPRFENVEAIADLGIYRIVARVDGTYPNELTVNLFSDPPLPQSDLSRLAVLGGLPGQFSGFNDPNQGGSSLGALSGTGVSFLSGMLTNRVTEKIGKMLLLSEVSFDFIPPASYVIKLAKALDSQDNFLLTLTRVLRDNGLNENLYGIEWRLTQNFLTRIALDQFNQMRFWVQSINRF
jgi:hypothetical protein